MARILIVYGSSQGQTAKIAGVIAEELRASGNTVHVLDSRSGGEPSPLSYDGVIAGASVHARGYQKKLVNWVARHAAELSERPSAFFSVCLGVLQEDPSVQREEREIVTAFFRRTGWSPARWEIFAGALSYTKLNFLLKRVIRRIARKAGGGTDIRRDYEYTDWRAVRGFARDFERDLREWSGAHQRLASS
jgi:menaquinone-dependent protoporphyrinogen oxidase